jgi:hypothetical protein
MGRADAHLHGSPRCYAAPFIFESTADSQRIADAAMQRLAR